VSEQSHAHLHGCIACHSLARLHCRYLCPQLPALPQLPAITRVTVARSYARGCDLSGEGLVARLVFLKQRGFGLGFNTSDWLLTRCGDEPQAR
jgi:hypothetical protein